MPMPLNVAGDRLYAANTNLLPRGRFAYASTVAGQTGIAGAVDLTGLSVTFTAVASRFYRTVVVIPVASQVTASGYWTGVITDAANVVKQQLQGFITSGEDTPMVWEIIETGLSGSITRKARLQTSGGTITLPGAIGTRYIVVEDLGA